MKLVSSKLILFFLTMSLTACFTTTPLVSPMEFSLYPDNSIEQVEKAIKNGAIDRGWTVEKVGDGEAVLNLRVRSHEIKSIVTYNTKKLSVFYKDSANMKYDGRNIHKKYHMWVDRLGQSIKQRLRQE